MSRRSFLASSARAASTLLVMVLTLIPSMSDAEPLTIEEAAATQKIIDNLKGTKRLLIHGRVNPNQDGDIDRMEQLHSRSGVVGWKTYTRWGPADNAYHSLETGLGFELTDERYRVPFIERARGIGVRNICIHKGIPFGRDASYKYARCDDIGKAARKFPDMSVLVYPASTRRIPSCRLSPGPGATASTRWCSRCSTTTSRPTATSTPTSGRPGTCSGATLTRRRTAWASCLRDRHGYPEITPALRAKVFGLNATRPDRISAEEVKLRSAGGRIGTKRLGSREDPDPLFLTYGPKTKEFERLMEGYHDLIDSGHREIYRLEPGTKG